MEEKLIEFLKFYKREVELNNSTAILFDEKTWAKMFLNSIDFDETCERKADSNNEDKRKICPYCGLGRVNVNYTGNIPLKTCDSCNKAWTN